MTLARILVVDDEPAMVEMVIDHLTSAGYDAVGAKNAEEAFTAMQAVSPDVVLLDVTMPIVDGVTVLRRLRVTHPDVPIIMMTANVDLALARDTLKLGAFDYVAKPFDFDHLAHVVEAAVAHRA